MLISRTVVYRPSKRTGSSDQHARNTATASSIRDGRCRNGVPNDSNSASCQPVPTPNRKRPPLRMSSSAACFATSTGCRCGSTSTLDVKMSRLLHAARYASVVSTSCWIVGPK